MKGKDMILSNFLSRQRVDKGNPHEIIPISFDMKAILKERYHNIGNESRYLVQTALRLKIVEVHSANKGINPDLKPERQALKSQNSANKPRLEQGKESLRKEMRAPPTQAQAQVQIKHENQTRKQRTYKHPSLSKPLSNT